jgi:hypothetical protein
MRLLSCFMVLRHRQQPTGLHLRGASLAPVTPSLSLRDPLRLADFRLGLLFPL